MSLQKSLIARAILNVIPMFRKWKNTAGKLWGRKCLDRELTLLQNDVAVSMEEEL